MLGLLVDALHGLGLVAVVAVGVVGRQIGQHDLGPGLDAVAVGIHPVIVAHPRTGLPRSVASARGSACALVSCCWCRPPVAAEIDGLRRAFADPALERVAPHITLVPPVNVAVDAWPQALALVRAAAGRSGPLELPSRARWPRSPPTSTWPTSR